MKKIYISHSIDTNYKTELYNPIRNSSLNSKYKFIFPHETDSRINSKEIIKTSSLVIAEVSLSATGVGIELGWADSFSIPIICIHKEGTKPQGSLKIVSRMIVCYSDATDMVSKIDKVLHKGVFSH